MGYASADIAERFQWTFPIVIAPTDPTVIYAGSQHVWKSTNEGQSWAKISPDLTRHDPKTMGASGGPITKDNTGVETYATVFTIAPSREGRQRHLGRIRRRLRAGDAQRRHELEERHAERYAATTRASASSKRRRSAPARAYVAANRYQQDDFKPYVFRTDDYGETWTPITNGVGADRFRARDPRGPQAREAPVSRHRARHLRVVRRRRELAVAAAEPAGHAGARHRSGGARPRHRDARPRLLRDGRDRAAAPGRHPDDIDVPSLQTRRRAARTRSGSGGRLLPEAAGAEAHDGAPRRPGKGDPHVHRHAGRRRAQAAGAGGDDEADSVGRRIRIRR